MNYLLRENFDNLQGWKLYKSAVSPDYKNSYNYSLKFITNGSYAITPLLTTPQNIQLHYKVSTHETWGTDKWGNPAFYPVDQLFLYYSKDLKTWTKINCGGPEGGIFPSKDIPEHEIKYFYKSITANLSLYENIYLKLERVNRNGGKVAEDFYIDDVIIENKIKSYKTNVVISAYDAAEFIEECLDSIKKQIYPVNKILLGIDGCPKTLEKAKSISWKYDNLEIYNAEENKGKYVTINSLIDLVPNDEYFITFDADDVMNPDMVSKMTINTQTKVCDDGVIFVSKEIFNKIGGYQDWKCAADSELLKRLNKVTNVNRIGRLYFRREHSKQLTKMPETKFGSELRRTYTKIMNENKETKIEPKKNEVKKIQEMDELDIKIFGMLEDMEKVELREKVERLENEVSQLKTKIENIEISIKRDLNKKVEKGFFSIIIPTMWCSNLILKMLELYEKNEYVKEIIIIDNDPSKKYNISKYTKVIYYTEGKNIYVNPSWNIGASMANYKIILANDDIFIEDFDNVIDILNDTDFDIVGIDIYSKKQGVQYIEEILKFPQKSYGCFMYIRNYFYIPEQFKIWYGDDLNFYFNNKRGILKNCRIFTTPSTTINSNKSEFREKIGSNDIIEYNKIFKKTNTEHLNFIIRTSGRPKYFQNCIKSIKKYYPNAILHISIDDYNDLNYVENICEGMNYNYYLINKKTVENFCKKIKIDRQSFVYNFYFNIIKPFLNGWCIFLDDDDELLINPIFDQEDNNKIFLFKVDIGHKIVPSTELFGKRPILNNISGLSIIFHSSQMVDWTPQRGGDYQFIKQMYDKCNPVWIDRIISKVQSCGNFGNRKDLSHFEKRVSVNMATYPPRKNVLIKSLNNLISISTIDVIRVYLNEYIDIPEDFPKNKKIQYHIGSNLKDSGKFFWANDKKDEYYFTIDDDLLYPENYFINHISLLKKYNNDIIVTSHGKIMNKFPKVFNDCFKSFHCLKDVNDNTWINNVGTGVMVFDNKKISIPIELFEYHGMADLWISFYAQKNKIPILCRKHDKNELQYLLSDNEETLFEKRFEMEENHKRILNKIGEWQLYKL